MSHDANAVRRCGFPSVDQTLCFEAVNLADVNCGRLANVFREPKKSSPCEPLTSGSVVTVEALDRMSTSCVLVNQEAHARKQRRNLPTPALSGSGSKGISQPYVS
jgi:hypothetical protein